MEYSNYLVRKGNNSEEDNLEFHLSQPTILAVLHKHKNSNELTWSSENMNFDSFRYYSGKRFQYNKEGQNYLSYHNTIDHCRSPYHPNKHVAYVKSAIIKKQDLLILKGIATVETAFGCFKTFEHLDKIKAKNKSKTKVTLPSWLKF